MRRPSRSAPSSTVRRESERLVGSSAAAGPEIPTPPSRGSRATRFGSALRREDGAGEYSPGGTTAIRASPHAVVRSNGARPRPLGEGEGSICDRVGDLLGYVLAISFSLYYGVLGLTLADLSLGYADVLQLGILFTGDRACWRDHVFPDPAVERGGSPQRASGQ